MPTFAELGIGSLDSGLWMGLVAPKGTPQAVIETLNAALVKVMATPAMKDKLAKLGATPLNPALSAFTDRIQSDRRAWDSVLKTVDLKTN